MMLTIGALVVLGVFSTVFLLMAANIPTTFVEKLLAPILLRLADDAYLRQRALRLGVLLYITSYILQMVASY
jgi:hypothetical protein